MSQQQLTNDSFHTNNNWKASSNKQTDHSELFLGFYADNLIQRANLADYAKKNQQDIKVLDLACGTGLVAFKLENLLKDISVNSVRIEAIDFGPSVIQAAQEKKVQRGSQLTNFIVMDGQDLKFADETFDFVFANMGVLFYRDLHKGLQEIRRVLKPNGRAFVNTWGIDYLAKVPFEMVLKKTEKPIHVPWFELQDGKIFQKKAQEAGFTSVELETVEHIIETPFQAYYDSLKLHSMLGDVDELIEGVANHYNVKDYTQVIEIASTAHVLSLTK